MDILIWLLGQFIIWFIPFVLSIIAIMIFVDWIDTAGRMPMPEEHKVKTQQNNMPTTSGQESPLMKKVNAKIEKDISDIAELKKELGDNTPYYGERRTDEQGNTLYFHGMSEFVTKTGKIELWLPEDPYSVE